MYDAFSVRATLEGMGCRIVGERGLDGPALERLVAMLAEQHEVLRADGWSDERAMRWHDLNLEFHRKLLALADNRWLAEAVRRACQLPIIFDSNLRPHNRDASTLLYQRGQVEQALKEHRQIVESLSRQEAGEAEAVMREHIIANRDLLVRYLGQQNGRVRALA
ncbi:FCD domain-containing protein [Variovorax sp. E3]|uniref:FCD domain-containing protein n=1 Tax=Variovorax sp. E3 TaxID=1914993 RepID=UPI0018DBF170|nr:FCD domain-containing protein [Variovorax sp. E3]